MPTMVPHHQVRVQRDGVNITPPVGKPFDFTADEIKEIRAHNFHALRKPVNEGGPRTAMTETELLSGAKVPDDPNATRDATLLSRAKNTSGSPGARNAGGSTEEADTARGSPRPQDVTLNTAEDAKRRASAKASGKPAPQAAATDEDDDEL